MKSSKASSWKAALHQRLHFHRRYRFVRFIYLIYRALVAFGPRCAIAYLKAGMRLPSRRTEPAAIPLGHEVALALRDCHTDLGIFEQVMLLGDLSFEDDQLNPRYIIDAGAHIGCASIYYALKYPAAQIIAVEAEASNFSQLCKNTAGIPAIRPLHAAVFHRSGQVCLLNPTDQPWGFQFGGQGESPTDSRPSVRAVTVAELIDLSGFPHVDILKLDIEGAEREVFASDSQSWLQQVRVMTVELHDRIKPGCTASFEKAVSTLPHETSKTFSNVLWRNLSSSGRWRTES